MPTKFFDYGALVRVYGVFTDSSGTAIDPTTVKVAYRADAIGTTTIWTYGTDAQVIRSATGTYYADIDSNESSGRYEWNIYSVGTGQAADNGDFFIRRALTTPAPPSDPLTTLNGANVTFLQAGTGAVTRSVRDKLRDTIAVEDFGAIGDDSTDNLTMLNNAFSQTGRVIRLSEGKTYRYSANLDVPTCAAIIGGGKSNTSGGADAGVSILKPGAAVTKALSLDNNCLRIADLKIDGSLTSGAKGLVLGDGTAWKGSIERVAIWDFTGSNAVGLHVGDVTDGSIWDARLEGSTINLLFDGITDNSFPTTIRLYGGYIREATSKGMKAISAYGVNFYGTIFESNAEEGVYLDGTDALNNILGIQFYGCWFENNYGATTTEYQFKADGSATTVWFKIADTFFGQSGSTAKAIHATGSGCNGVKIDNPRFVSVANCIRISSSARAHIELGPEHSYSTIVDASGAGLAYNVIDRFQSAEAEWTNWTPTYSSSAGNAATTYSGSVTTNVARYKLVGKTLKIELSYTGTLNAVTPNTLLATPPSGITGSDTFAIPGIARIVDNSAAESGYVQLHLPIDGGLIQASRMNGTNFTSAGVVAVHFRGDFEIA